MQQNGRALSGSTGGNEKKNRHKKVLIVEDELVTAEQMKLDLLASGFDVIGVCVSGKEAIRVAQETAPDIVLMDIRLKGEMDGFETAIAMQNTLDRSLNFIFMSAYFSPEMSLKETNARFLPKPVAFADVLAKIEESLS